MTQSEKDTVKIVIGVSLIGFLLFILFRKKNIASDRTSDFKKRLVENAITEWKHWRKGATKEGSKSTMDRLRQYWQEGANVQGWSDQKMKDEAWSAAFISWLMRISGAGDDWKYSPSHSTYIIQSIKNRKENNKNPFKGYRPDEVTVGVGDVLGRPRQSGITYDSTGAYKSHTDVVVGIKNGQAITIGGNISDSVSITYVPLTPDGHIDNTRVKGYPYHVVIKNNK